MMKRIFRNLFKHQKYKCTPITNAENSSVLHVGPSTQKVISSQIKYDHVLDSKDLPHRLPDIKRTLFKKHNVTFEKVPIKSENDTKEYLVMKLQNGLTALLVSDMDRTEETEKQKKTQHANTFSKSDTDKENEEEDTKQKEKLAACSLTVNVGSFEDPDEIPGLAHLLEHMLFMGSKKFPKENDFNSFVTTRGGSNNAMTDCEYSTYYFDCPEPYLEETMDRFTSFFIAPLMKHDSMIRERESVESEYQMHSTNDALRIQQIITSTASANSPAHKFLFGNLKTLKDNVEDDVLERSLREFWSRHYSAHRMTVAVQARLPLSTLGNLVANYFGQISTNLLPKTTFSNMDNPFEKELFNKLFTVMPVSNVNMLKLTWVMPPIQHLYKSKPTLYPSYMINHEGKGSLMAYLKNKLWALNVIGGSGSDGTENNTIYSFFSIVVLLTENGLSNVDKVLFAVFSYLKMMQTQPPSDKIWNEIKFMSDSNFRFSPEIPSADYVQYLSQCMQIYSSEDYMTGNRLVDYFAPMEIKDMVKLLTPDNVNIILLSKKAASKVKLDKKEKWFKGKYNVRDIPDKWLYEWTTTEKNTNFFLPTPNPFIPSDFRILPDDKVSSSAPIKIRHDRFLELWFKQDKKFLLPFGYISIYLTSPYATISPQNFVMSDLFVAVFTTMYDEDLYPASVAGLAHSLSTSDYGLLLSITGYNEKMLFFLKTILDLMMSFNQTITPGIFEAVKEEQRKLYYNEVLNPSALARDMRLSVLCDPYCTSVSKLNVISTIDMKTLQEFTWNFLENLYCKCLIQGNISKKQAMDMADTLQSKLNYKPLLEDCCPVIRVRQLPNGEKIIRVKSLNDQDLNCHITNYYQSGLNNNMTESCLIELIMMAMAEPLFDTLRTKEQLGYFVHNDIKYTYGVIGFTVAVKFQADKFNVDHVETRMTEFLKKMSADLRDMTDETFNQLKESMKLLKCHVDTQLADEVERNWSEIESNEYVFDRLQREMNFLETVKKQDVYNYFTQILKAKKTQDGEKSLRKLSVQVDSKDLSSNSKESSQNNSFNNLTHNIKYIVPPDKRRNKFIDNIESFQNKLHMYPVLKNKL